MPLAVITTSAAKGERAEVIHLIAETRVFGKRHGRPRCCVDELEADKGYDANKLRKTLRSKGIKLVIGKRIWQNRKHTPGRKPPRAKNRFKVEHCCAWIQRKFRRLCVRWERRRQYWNGFMLLAVGCG